MTHSPGGLLGRHLIAVAASLCAVGCTPSQSAPATNDMATPSPAPTPWTTPTQTSPVTPGSPSPSPALGPTPTSTVVPLDWQSVQPPGSLIGPIFGTSNGYVTFAHDECRVTCIVSSAAYSEDGIDWSTMNSPEGTFERAEIVDVIAYDDGFLAVGEILPAESENVTGAVWISVDRETWQLVEGSQMDTGPLYGVCEGIGYWRAEHKGAAAENRVLQVGTVIVDTDYDCRPLRDPTADTYLRSSTNTTEWQPEPVPAEIAQTDDYWNDSVRTLIGGRQFLIAANDRPAILRSSDGASWEVANLEGAADARVTQLVELDDGYLALGWSSTAFSERTVWSSQDGAEWTVALKVAAEDDNPLVSMTSFGSGVVARGFFRFEPDKPSTLGVSVSFDGSRWSYPQSHPFEGQAFDQMASNGTSVLVATLDDDGAGDLLMWRADVSGLQP